MQTNNVIYTAKVHTTGGRDGGVSRSSDGRLDIRHSVPGSMGAGTNPEQLLAAGWSACFEGAMGHVARQMKIALPADMAIDAEVDLCLVNGGVFPASTPQRQSAGLGSRCRESLTDAAHQACPYSKAIRGNVEVEIHLVD